MPTDEQINKVWDQVAHSYEPTGSCTDSRRAYTTAILEAFAPSIEELADQWERPLIGDTEYRRGYNDARRHHAEQLRAIKAIDKAKPPLLTPSKENQ
jgi:hypothetical protein